MNSPFAGLMPPPNPHQVDPYTFSQGPDDRFPRTQGLGQMQGVEGMMQQLDEQKLEADLQKDLASYESKKISQTKTQMQSLMEMLKGNGGF